MDLNCSESRQGHAQSQPGSTQTIAHHGAAGDRLRDFDSANVSDGGPKADIRVESDLASIADVGRCAPAVQQRKLYSITPSARASSVGGMSRLIALAVLRLITNSYLVGACTGRSAGLAPFKMRST
jgi:hypothetical protein